MASIQQVAQQISSVQAQAGQAALILTLAVRYDRHGTPAAELKGRLHDAARRVANDARLTAGGPAKVESWPLDVIEL